MGNIISVLYILAFAAAAYSLHVRFLHRIAR